MVVVKKTKAAFIKNIKIFMLNLRNVYFCNKTNLRKVYDYIKINLRNVY